VQGYLSCEFITQEQAILDLDCSNNLILHFMRSTIVIPLKT
jgi:hypothetical protein